MVAVSSTIKNPSKACKRPFVEKTERYQLLSTLFEIATDAIFVIDLDGRIILFNEAAYKQRGYGKDEMCNMTLFELDSPKAAKQVKTRLDTILRDGSAIFESEHL